MQASFLSALVLLQLGPTLGAPLLAHRRSVLSMRDAATELIAPPQSNSTTASISSSDIPGTIEIMLPDSPSERVGALTLAQDTTNSSLAIDMSNATAPTRFMLHPESSAPPVQGHQDWMPVSLRIAAGNSSVPASTQMSDLCAEFQSDPGAQAPVVVKPCLPNWDTSNTTSQLFVYDTVTGQISPFWASLSNSNDTSANSTAPSSPATPAANNVTASVNSTASAPSPKFMPAMLFFSKDPVPPSDADASTYLAASDETPSVNDAEDDEVNPEEDDENDDEDDETDDGDDEEDDEDEEDEDDASEDTTTDDSDSTQLEDFIPVDSNSAPTDDPSINTDVVPDASTDPNVALLTAPASAAPAPSSPTISFDEIDPSAPCTSGDATCSGDQFALCSNNVWVLSDCGPGTVCRVVEQWQAPGVTVPVCDTPEDADFRNSPDGHRKRDAGASASGGKETRKLHRVSLHGHLKSMWA